MFILSLTSKERRLAIASKRRKSRIGREALTARLHCPQKHLMLMRALSLSLAQLGDRKMIGIFAKSMLLSLIVFGALATAVLAASKSLAEASGWFDTTNSYFVVLGVTIAGLLIGSALFRAIAIPVLGFFGDEVVAAVETRHYPSAAKSARPAGYGLSIKLGLGSLGRFLLVNGAALPLYLFLLVTAVGPLVLFVILNAILLGRDLAEMVGVRHLDTPALKIWLRQSRWDRLALGLIVTGLFLIPFVNLIAPLLGAAAATHLFHERRV
jgi:CysZ protein